MKLRKIARESAEGSDRCRYQCTCRVAVDSQPGQLLERPHIKHDLVRRGDVHLRGQQFDVLLTVTNCFRCVIGAGPVRFPAGGERAAGQGRGTGPAASPAGSGPVHPDAGDLPGIVAQFPDRDRRSGSGRFILRPGMTYRVAEGRRSLPPVRPPPGQGRRNREITAVREAQVGRRRPPTSRRWPDR